MRSWIAVVSAWWCAVALLDAAPAKAMSCASAVILDGHVLYGGGVPHRERLPELGASLRAIEPACGDDDHNRDVNVTAFRDLPATVAAWSKDTYSRLYVAAGTLVATADHPLHRAFFGENRPSARRGRSCRTAGRLAGTAAQPTGFSTLVLRTSDGERYVRVDAKSRLANRPAYQPLSPGQRLTVGVQRCGRRLVATRIRFIGPNVRPDLVTVREDGSDLWLILGAIGTMLMVCALVVRLIVLPAVRESSG